MYIAANQTLAIEVTRVIRAGDTAALSALLSADPSLAVASIVDGRGVGRPLLHLVADWPGHLPNGGAMVAALVAAGADPNAAAVLEGPSDAVVFAQWPAARQLAARPERRTRESRRPSRRVRPPGVNFPERCR